jgi:uncharacterized protein YlxW (UPF0749 family)
MDFITKPMVIGLAVIVFILAMYSGWLSIEKATLETKVAIKDTRIAKLEANEAAITQANHELKDSIIKYDSKMDEMRKQAAERATKVMQDQVAASIIAKRHRGIATNITNMKRYGNDECRDTKRLVDTYLKAKK